MRPFDPRAVAAFALTAIVISLFGIPILMGRHTVTDDYYFYERIARHIVGGGGSTFDGVVATNGYHPLWMLVVTAGVALEKLTSIFAQYWVLLVSAALIAGTICIVGASLRTVTPLAIGGLTAIAAYGVFFGIMGMETSPVLFFAALYYRHARLNDFSVDVLTGIWLAACFLSRIDSLVYFLLPTLVLCLRSSRRNLLLFALPVALTVCVYALANQIYFGVPVPISGIAKSVRSFSGFHGATWHTLLLRGLENQLLLLTAILMTVPVIAFIQLGFRRYLVLASAAGVLFFYGLNSLRSDWGIEEWYLYPFACHVVLLTFLSDVKADSAGASRIGRIVLLMSISALAFVGFRDDRHARRQAVLMIAAEKLRDIFANDPHAVIAMGDRSGVVGELLPNRVVQLEGLVMDRQFLQEMRRATGTILPVLRAYQVDFYIATNPRAEKDGCFTTWEPSQSHGYSIKVQSLICAPVAAEFDFEGTRTVVLQMNPLHPLTNRSG